jgi:hypothetical protein
MIEDIQNSKDSEYARWVDTRLDRWIIDWVLRHGRVQTARHIAQEKSIEVSPKPTLIPFLDSSLNCTVLLGTGRY